MGQRYSLLRLNMANQNLMIFLATYILDTYHPSINKNSVGHAATQTYLPEFRFVANDIAANHPMRPLFIANLYVFHHTQLLLPQISTDIPLAISTTEQIRSSATPAASIGTWSNIRMDGIYIDSI